MINNIAYDVATLGSTGVFLVVIYALGLAFIFGSVLYEMFRGGK